MQIVAAIDGCDGEGVVVDPVVNDIVALVSATDGALAAVVGVAVGVIRSLKGSQEFVHLRGRVTLSPVVEESWRKVVS